MGQSDRRKSGVDGEWIWCILIFLVKNKIKLLQRGLVWAKMASIMQVARRHTRVAQASIKWDRRVFAAPLVVAIAMLTISLAWASWCAADHQPIVLPAWAPCLVLWLILGIAGFFMPMITRMQQLRLDEIKNLKAALADRENSLREAMERGANASEPRLEADLSRGMTSFLALPPPVRAGVQHVCLTPRILAQRPIHTRVPRG